MLTVIRNYLRGRGEYELFVLDLIQEYLRYFRVKEARSLGKCGLASQNINT